MLPRPNPGSRVQRLPKASLKTRIKAWLFIRRIHIERGFKNLMRCRGDHDFKVVVPALNAVFERCTGCGKARFRVMKPFRFKLWLNNHQ